MLPLSAAQPAVLDLQRLYGGGKFQAAAELGWQMLRLDPHDRCVLNLLALAEHRRGNHQVGIVLLQRAIKAEPENYVYWNDLGNIFFSQGDMDAAIAAYRKALQLNSRCAESFSNLGALYYKQADHTAARCLLEQALAIRPHYPDALYNLGNVLAALGKYQKAAARYELAVQLRPEHPSSHFNLGITRLLLGELSLGWPEWEWRWRSTQAPYHRSFCQPAWTGEALHGRRILLYAEQGIGDTLQFLRYLDKVVARGGLIVLEAQRPLLPLLQHHPAIHVLVAHGDPLPVFEVQCPLMSLGAVFKTTLSSIPPVDHYLRSTEASSALEADPNAPLRAGIVWAGNPVHERDKDRSMTLESLAPLFSVEGVKWHSLQHGRAADQLAGLPGTVHAEIFRSVENLGAGFTSFADTKQAIEQLDLVITVDTSVAHLAGSMGKPVWIMLPCHPDWRWLLKRRDSLWYPSARLFRQTHPGDWTSVVNTVKAELERLARC